MKVKELIEQLQQLDPELFVFRPGYEGGFKDVNVGEVGNFKLNVNTEWYYGPHEKVVEEANNESIIKGIVL